MIGRVGIVGAGASGLAAAIAAARAGAQVTVIEHMDKAGKKILSTGSGRCNLSNRKMDASCFRCGQDGFPMKVIGGFGLEETLGFFEGLGILIKDRNGYLYPYSDQASSVRDVLLQEAERRRVQIHLSCHISGIEEDAKGGFLLHTDQGRLKEDALILAAGSKDAPATGSDGSGYTLAQEVGHTIVPTWGSLVPLEEDGDYCARLQGLSLRNCAIKVKNQAGKTIYQDFGELLFTHFGLSGPVILSASAHGKPGDLHTVFIDLKPALDEQKLDLRILRDFEQYQNRTIEHALQDLYPRLLIPVMVERAGIPPETRANSVTRAQRRRLLELTKAFPVKIRGRRPVEEAIITAGGVSVREVNPKTMESKLVHGLYLAGEILDVDGYTGGFNLQIAWATGRAAGLAAARKEEEERP